MARLGDADDFGVKLAEHVGAPSGWSLQAGSRKLRDDALLQLNILQTVVFSDHKDPP